MQIKTQDIISPTAQNGHPPKDFVKIKCCTGRWELGILPHCRRDIGRKTARRFLNTLNIVYNITWFPKPAPWLRSTENHNLKWHMHPYFQGSAFRNILGRALAKISTDRKLSTWSIHTPEYTQPSKRAGKKCHHQQHGWAERWPQQVNKRGREIDHLQVKAINSYQRTHLQTDSQTQKTNLWLLRGKRGGGRRRETLRGWGLTDTHHLWSYC